MRKFFQTIDKVLTKTENTGHKTANFLYKSAINLMLVGMGYNIYTTLRDYNTVQKESRKKELYLSKNKKYFEEENN